LNERLVAHIFKAVKGIDLPLPFPRLTYAEAMDRYGCDKPDTRYGLELVEVSDLVADSGFKVFSGAVKSGGMVKILPIPGGNEAISNVRIKPGGDLFKIAADAGARGLAYIRVREGGTIDTIGAIKDNLSDAQKQEILERTGAQEGHLLLFGAGDAAIVNATLDRVRQAIAKEMNLIPDDALNLLWVTDFPMFEWNADEKRYEALHHPFTAPNPEDIADLTTGSGPWPMTWCLTATKLAAAACGSTNPTFRPRCLKPLASVKKKPTTSLVSYWKPLNTAPHPMAVSPTASTGW
jgi:aspartyl-tRNA synthetase